MNLVQSAVNYNSSTTGIPISLTGVTSGNTLVLGFGSAGTNLTQTVSDTVNGTWTGPAINGHAFFTCSIWVFPNSAAGSVTVNASHNAASSLSLCLMEFSGVATSSVVDVTKAQSGSGGTSVYITATTGATTKPVEAVIGFFQSNTNHTFTVSVPAGLVLLSPATAQYACAYYITSATGTQAMTLTTEANTSFDGVLATLLPPAIVPPATPTTTKGIIAVRSTSQT